MLIIIIMFCYVVLLKLIKISNYSRASLIYFLLNASLGDAQISLTRLGHRMNTDSIPQGQEMRF